MVGIDEVGRGCLAGPLLVVAAEAKSDLPSGLKDSKLLSKKQREDFYEVLVSVCDFGEGWVSAAEINKQGLARSLKLGVHRALKSLDPSLDEDILIDGAVNYIPAKFKKSRCEAKADNTYPIVSAASIIAKVKRDKYMAGLAQQHPGYGFETHVGYGTAIHRQAIAELGALEGIHRTIFANFSKASLWKAHSLVGRPRIQLRNT